MDQSSVTLKEFLEARLNAQDQTSAQILAEVKLTNGRVRMLEAKVVVLQIGYGIGAFLAAGYVMGWFQK